MERANDVRSSAFLLESIQLGSKSFRVCYTTTTTVHYFRTKEKISQSWERGGGGNLCF